MKTILIIYWSQTGNTEAMAHAIAQGIEEEGNQAKLLEVSEAEPEILKKGQCICSGLSGYGRRGSGRGRDGTVCNKV